MATSCDDDIQVLKDEIRDLKGTVATLRAVIASTAPTQQHPRPGSLHTPRDSHGGSVAPPRAPVQVYQGYECDSDDNHSPMQCCSAMFEREADMRAHLGSDW